MNVFFGLIPDTAASAIWAMVVASLLPLVMALSAKALGGFRLADNAHPRRFLQETTGVAARANAAQQNSYETLPVFLAAVLVAMLFFVPQLIVNVLALVVRTDSYWLLHRLYQQFSDVSFDTVDAVDGVSTHAVLFSNTCERLALGLMNN